jgi:hypothetical protein
MEETKDRCFEIISAGNTMLNSQIGKLVGDIDYRGCKSGWHTLDIKGNTYLFTGDEIREVFKYDKKI